jgi:hypothetical protein
MIWTGGETDKRNDERRKILERKQSLPARLKNYLGI